MSKPSPRSNLIQTLLIASVLFLGLQLFMPKPEQQPAVPPQQAYPVAQQQLQERQLKLEEARKTAEPETIKKAQAEVDEAQATLARLTPQYAAALRKEGNIEEARTLELQDAQRRKQIAADKKDFNEALAAYNEFHRLYTEAPQSPIGLQAKQQLEETGNLGTEISRNSGGLTGAGFHVIDALVNLFGGERAPTFSYWFAALVLAVAVRLLIWPLAQKQMIGFKRMALLQPFIKELQEKYQGQELQMRTMKLYQKYGINPLAGCWPMLIQMPIFLWIFYSMRHYQFEFHKGTFLWITPEVAARFPGIVAPNLGERDVLLVLLYGISMLATTIFSVTDPAQAKQSRLIGIAMAVIFTILMLFWPFPSAFVLYWIGLNILATIQSVRISRMTVPPLVEIPEHEQKRGGLFGGMVPSDGPRTPTNGTPKTAPKTGAPVLHKGKNGKQKRKRK